MEYAKALDIPFAYLSNGDAFYENESLTGAERKIGLNEFPTYEKLIQRYKSFKNNGAPITPNEEKL